MIYANTVSRYPTHFLRAIELITKARTIYDIPSENWPYPTDLRFGIPNDRYYAEIWVDGMDYQPSYWVIEEKELKIPYIYPFIIFGSNDERLKFSTHDFEDLVKASLWYRRDSFFIKKGDLGYYTDLVWPFLFTIKSTYKHGLFEMYYKHASQERVNFIMNTEFIPLDYIGNKESTSTKRGGFPS